MALIQTITTPQGVDASYHKILKIEISAVEEAVTIVVAIFASAEARESGRQVLWHEYIRVPFSDMSMDPRVPFYQIAASYANSYLSGAERDARPDPIKDETVVVEEPIIDMAPVPPREDE